MPAERSRVLDVGNCEPDHASIRRLLSPFDVDVDRVMFVDEAVAALKERRYDLILVNRVIFADGSDGLTLIERMRGDNGLGDVPVMMISNYSDAQDRAVSAGAVRGFGKAEVTDPKTVEMLAPYLSKGRVG